MRKLLKKIIKFIKKLLKMNNKTMLCVGLFDKDTKKQEINTNEAMQIINNILLQYTEGATVYMGEGIYKHIDNATIIEPNVIILLYDINNSIINKIVDEVKQALNQEALMVERSTVEVDFI